MIKECLALYSMEENLWKFTTFLYLVNKKNCVFCFCFGKEKFACVIVSCRFLSQFVNCGKGRQYECVKDLHCWVQY